MGIDPWFFDGHYTKEDGKPVKRATMEAKNMKINVWIKEMLIAERF